jgi:asparagine synthase (glutamine-hydrolysing)
MCGIAGYIGLRAPDLLRAMADRMAHRGPDGEGYWTDDNRTVGLAHRRLAIIDPSEAAAQPLASCGGRYEVVFNGEIYNFRILGKRLRQCGYAFNARSDTAVLGPLYDLYGTAMLPMLNGIFAFALWDRQEEELLVARDAFGIKPLYYTELPGGGIAFASELKALVLVPGLDTQLSCKALSDYLTYLWSPGERTLFRSIRKLPPGTLIRASGKRIEVARWYEPRSRPVVTTRHVRTGELISQLNHLMDQVVCDQCMSDVPIGAFLSGGIDSSAVVASMVATGHTPRRTYCIGFDGKGLAEEGFDDDLTHAREVAKFLDVELTPIIVGAPGGDDFERLVYALDEPQADPAGLYVAAISAAARADGIKVLLGGAGGDDIFSGYRRHKLAAVRARLPAVLGRHLCGTPLTSMAIGIGPLKRRIDKLVYTLDGDDETFLVRSFEFSPRSAALECLTRDVIRELQEDETDWLEAAIERSRGLPLVERMLKAEQYGFLPDHNLNYTDKASMAHGIEVRVPLLDQRLVDFASRVPWQLKTGLTREKWIFRQAVAGRVPRSVLSRKKTGFGGPVRLWIAGHLRSMVEDIIHSRSFRERGLFDTRQVSRILEDTVSGRRDGAYLVLAITLVELWMRAFKDQMHIANRASWPVAGAAAYSAFR